MKTVKAKTTQVRTGEVTIS